MEPSKPDPVHACVGRMYFPDGHVVHSAHDMTEHPGGELSSQKASQPEFAMYCPDWHVAQGRHWLGFWGSGPVLGAHWQAVALVWAPSVCV